MRTTRMRDEWRARRDAERHAVFQKLVAQGMTPNDAWAVAKRETGHRRKGRYQRPKRFAHARRRKAALKAKRRRLRA